MYIQPRQKKVNEALIKRLGSLDSQKEVFDLGFIPTGSYALNHILTGNFHKGYPVGSLIEIWGESSTGKTAFLTHAIKEAQKLNYYTALADNEFSYNIEFATNLGVDSARLIYATPDTVIGCLKQVQDWVKEIRSEDKDTPILACIDSLAGQSGLESEKSIGDLSNTDGARRALEIGQGLRQIRPLLRANKVCLIVINQTRTNIAIQYGSNVTKSGGGKALAFWSDISLETVSNKTTDVLRDDNKEPYGIKGSIRNRKNKIGIPLRECEFRLDFNKGLDLQFGILPMLVTAKILEKNAAWYVVKSTGQKFQESSFINGEVNIPELTNLLQT